MTSFLIRKSHFADCDFIFDLYQIVSRIEGGLARKQTEISKNYVENFTKKAIQNGAQFVAVDSQANKIIGEIHGYCLEPAVFAHVLTELTIAVDPDYQGLGIGKRLFEALLRYLSEERKDILRVELIARKSNVKAIRLYEKLGFQIEGRFENRIRNAQGFEADIPMAWSNPNFHTNP